MKSKIKKLLALVIASAFFTSCAGIFTSSEETGADELPPAIIPLPNSLNWGVNSYEIPKTNTVCFSDGAEEAADWLQELLKSSNTEVDKIQGNSCGNWNLVTDPGLEEQLGEEGYILEISNNGVSLKGATEAGLFYAVQTLRQLFPAGIEQKGFSGKGIFLRQVYIEDRPNFSWRGNMIDVARSFFGIEYLKYHVDRMAAYKLNRLHLHLTDDQGWRIEIKNKPKLTEIGANSSVVDGNSGFLTQEEYIELQEYAAARNIIIIPEIDMPGHIYAALRAYPELNCADNSNLTPARATPPEPYRKYRVGWSKFCLEKPKVVYDFVSTVIGELAEITTGPWIHIGGDEIEDPLYEDFVIKADSIVRGYGKISIGWEEVTKAQVDSSLISQQWHGKVESVVDVKTIKSICSHFYLDHANVPGQENTNNWCKESGVSIEDVYSFSAENENIIGIEAAVWSEFVINDEMMDDRYWPRNLAVAEVAWTSESNRNFENFMERLGRQGERLKQMGIRHFQIPDIDWGEKEVEENPGTIFSGFMPRN